MKRFPFVIWIVVLLAAACSYEEIESVYMRFDRAGGAYPEFYKEAIQTRDGGYAVAGSKLSGANAGLFVRLFDMNGDSMRTAIVQLGNYIDPIGIVESSNGDFIVGGADENNNIIARVTAEGSVRPPSVISNLSYMSGFDEAANGDVFVLGTVEQQNDRSIPVLIHYPNLNGNFGQPKHMLVPGFEGKKAQYYNSAIKMLPDGNIALAISYTEENSAITQSMLLVVNTSGQQVGTPQVFTGAEGDLVLRKLDVDAEGTMYATGEEEVNGQTNILIVRAPQNGNPVSKTLGENFTEQGNGIEVNTESIAIAGIRKLNDANTVAFYILDLQTLEPIKPGITFNGPGAGEEDFGYSVHQTIDKGFILAAYTTLNNNFMGYLIKTDPEGN